MVVQGIPHGANMGRRGTAATAYDGGSGIHGQAYVICHDLLGATVNNLAVNIFGDAAVGLGNHDHFNTPLADLTLHVNDGGDQVRGADTTISPDRKGRVIHFQAEADDIGRYWAAVNNKILGHTEKAADLANRAAYRNTLSPNLPFFRDEAIALLEELEAD